MCGVKCRVRGAQVRSGVRDAGHGSLKGAGVVMGIARDLETLPLYRYMDSQEKQRNL